MEIKEKQIAEAIKRLKFLNLNDYVIEDFQQEQKVHYSEREYLDSSGEFGALFWVSDEPKYVEVIRHYEDQFGCLVYHAIYQQNEVGELFSLLYISPYEEEWTMDWELFSQGNRQDGYIQYAKVINLSMPLFSETGTIHIKESGGGLIRIG